jgi:hypothetical protein
MAVKVGGKKFYGTNKKPPARPEVECTPLCHAARYVSTTRMKFGRVLAFIAAHLDRYTSEIATPNRT